MTVPGIGPIISSAMVAAIGTGEAFSKGRDFGAWLGLVPKQISTGDRTILGSISKRGNRYLRALFVQAAWVVLVKVGPRCSPIGAGDDIPFDFSCEDANLFERRLSVLAGCPEHVESRRLIKRKAGDASGPLDRDPQRDATAVRMAHEVNGPFHASMISTMGRASSASSKGLSPLQCGLSPQPIRSGQIILNVAPRPASIFATAVQCSLNNAVR
jgi:Transposase IS116/IS110/IS902 family